MGKTPPWNVPLTLGFRKVADQFRFKWLVDVGPATEISAYCWGWFLQIHRASPGPRKHIVGTSRFSVMMARHHRCRLQNIAESRKALYSVFSPVNKHIYRIYGVYIYIKYIIYIHNHQRKFRSSNFRLY